jgi:hypothetical protein
MRQRVEVSMARLVILKPDESSDHVLLTRPARLRERLAARWRAHILDVQLAHGTEPEAGAALALRAHALGEPRMRKLLARGVQRVLQDARSPQRPHLARIPAGRREVLAAADELDELTTRLRSPGLLAPRGLASVHLLLSDGGGPLYARSATGELRAAVSHALEALEPSLEW